MIELVLRRTVVARPTHLFLLGAAAALLLSENAFSWENLKSHPAITEHSVSVINSEEPDKFGEIS